MLSQGTMIDGRYKVISRLGSGGMADVYLCQDEHLGRQVALKIMHERFAQDAEFVERFEREAQSAAALQHKNVVNVFDRGVFGGTYYIAMEYLPGRSLKDVIVAMGALDPRLAIHIALQILAAARFAHAKGVIHRDIKPQNVMIDDEWNVKVTDFGIASKPSSDVTQTGTMLGTAQYISPEQAQGRPVSAASDIYSIGVVVFEMLTGRVPFDSDTTVATALKHVNEPPPHPSSVVAGVSPVLDQIVMRALAKDPAHRFSSASEFSAALEQSRGAPVEPAGKTEIRTAPTVIATPAATPDSQEPPPKKDRRWWIVAGVVALLAVAGVLAFILLKGGKEIVPSVVGRSVADAQSRLATAGFKSEVFRQRDNAPVDEVFSQSPGGGTKADGGATVILNVSSGPGFVDLPTVENLTRADAEKRLEALGLKVELRREFSKTVQAGFATRTVPAAKDKAERGSTVNLYISKGPREVEVPDVVGLDRGQAQKKLSEAGFKVEFTQKDGPDPENEASEQSPAAGVKAEDGSTVKVTTGSGFNDVPDVTGLDETDATRELKDAGFKVSRTDVPADNPDDDGAVINQVPDSGRQAVGTPVAIEIGVFSSVP